MNDWIPLDATKLKDIGGRSARTLSIRVFGKNGKLFSRLTLSIWNDVFNGGIKIIASKKNKPGEWWEDCGIPKELLPIVVEMISEISEK